MTQIYMLICNYNGTCILVLNEVRLRSLSSAKWNLISEVRRDCDFTAYLVPVIKCRL